MNKKDFNFKGKLQDILAHAMSDIKNAGKFQNFFFLYSKLYVEPHMDEVVNNLEVDYDEVTEKLVPKQKEIFDAMLDDKFVSVFGSRKTGKTYLMALAMVLLGSKKRMKIHVLSSKKDTAAYLITMMIWIAEEFELDLFKRVSAEKCVFWNGTTVKIHSNTLADTGTYEADILIIDEAQEVQEEVWGKIMPQLMTGRAMYIWIMGTAKAGTMFHNFWFKKGTRFKKFELHMKDATWVSAEAWAEIIAIMPERMVRQELYLKWVEAEGAYFSADSVDQAFKDYKKFNIKDYGEIICSIDWGWGHETVMFVLGIKDGVVHELDCWGMQGATIERIIRQIEKYKRDYSCFFILEGGQTTALRVANKLDQKNISFKTSLFMNVKEYYWDALEFLLENNKIKLDNYRLKQQLLRYCGDKKDDDYVDALLHGTYYYVMKYLQEEYDDWWNE